MANSAICTAYRRMSGSMGEDSAAQAPAPQNGRPVEGDCPICYDDMEAGGTTAQVWGRWLVCSLCLIVVV